MSKKSFILNVYNILLYICEGKLMKLKNMYRIELYPLRLCLHNELYNKYFNVFLLRLESSLKTFLHILYTHMLVNTVYT